MSDEKKFESQYTKPQRIAAMICAVLIALAFIVTLILNMIGSEWANNAGRIALGCLFVLPILAWIYIWMIGHIFHKHTIADFDFLGNPTDHSPSITQADTEEFTSDK